VLLCDQRLPIFAIELDDSQGYHVVSWIIVRTSRSDLGRHTKQIRRASERDYDFVNVQYLRYIETILGSITTMCSPSTHPQDCQSTGEMDTNDELIVILAAIRVYEADQKGHPMQRADAAQYTALNNKCGADFLQTNKSTNRSDNAKQDMSLFEELVQFQRQHDIQGDNDVTTLIAAPRPAPLERSASTPTAACVARRPLPPRRASTDALAVSRPSLSLGRRPREVYRPPLCRSYFLQGAQSVDTSGDEALARRLHRELNESSDANFESPRSAEPSWEPAVPAATFDGDFDCNAVTRSCLDASVLSSPTHGLYCHERRDTCRDSMNCPAKQSFAKTKPHCDDDSDDSSSVLSATDDSSSANSNAAISNMDVKDERERILYEGMLITAQSVLLGQYTTVTCQGCRVALRTPLDYPLVYCQGCGVVSPTGGSFIHRQPQSN
jgi:hypothetical protein